MLEGPCTVRSTLEQVVRTARQTVHDTLGQMNKAARKSGREAVLTLEQHIEKHGCK
jgi:flagellar motor component MotA